MTLSISQRLVISSLLILACFLGLAGAVLDRAYRSSTESALRDELQAHVYTLLAAANEDAVGRMRLPQVLPTPAFNRPDSGLFAEIGGESGNYHWRSESLLGRPQLNVLPQGPGDSDFRLEPALALFDQGVGWEDDNGIAHTYTLTVASDGASLRAAQKAFRTTLLFWLGGIAIVLLLTQLLVLRWGLRPLRDMSDAVGRIERGEAARLDGPVPRELHGLTSNLNALIDDNLRRQQRVRNSLADLAHSLKTPLAVLRGAAGSHGDADQAALIMQQTVRIDEIVRYQRQRAAVAGNATVNRAIGVQAIVERLGNSLEKVSVERGIRLQLELPDGLQLRADEGDLYELFGNLLENAFRHAGSRVVIRAHADRTGTTIDIDDDGPGIAEADSQRLLQRGERADLRHPGEGIGLAVVSEIVNQYRGQIEILRSPIGGARIRIRLPA
ncbi:MAG: GHKL domain-containing protein [Gammaproteobacteria bacterium]|nr:GHKL domain-containing protein [Gammaproteobacteria bacterium]